jgi:hypothetical protein
MIRSSDKGVAAASNKVRVRGAVLVKEMLPRGHRRVLRRLVIAALREALDLARAADGAIIVRNPAHHDGGSETSICTVRGVKKLCIELSSIITSLRLLLGG